FGNMTAQPGRPTAQRNGFLALAEFDKPENGGNGDGWLDAADSVFGRLRIWLDGNQDGLSEPNEFLTLSAAGIEAISLKYSASTWTDAFGNQFRFRAPMRRSNGREGVVYDVLLRETLNPPSPLVPPNGPAGQRSGSPRRAEK